jgi:hypothetical protein
MRGHVLAPNSLVLNLGKGRCENYPCEAFPNRYRTNPQPPWLEGLLSGSRARPAKAPAFKPGIVYWKFCKNHPLSEKPQATRVKFTWNPW